MSMRKEMFIIILFFSLLAFAFFNPARHVNTSALVASGAEITDQEETFPSPVDVVWHGKIVSVMSDGACMGLEGLFGNYSKFMACLSDTHSDSNRAQAEQQPREPASGAGAAWPSSYDGLWNYSGSVTVTGKWLGITCAYRNTIFNECVPDVEIESIE